MRKTRDRADELIDIMIRLQVLMSLADDEMKDKLRLRLLEVLVELSELRVAHRRQAPVASFS